MTNGSRRNKAAPNSPSARSGRPTLVALLWRAVRLRCPACGHSPLFYGWFATYPICPDCGRKILRGPGYMLGSIYFNYGVTAMIVVVAYFAFFFADVFSGRQLLIILTLFSIVFPLWFFRYARSLWAAFDEYFDPWPNEEEARQTTASHDRTN